LFETIFSRRALEFFCLKLLEDRANTQVATSKHRQSEIEHQLNSLIQRAFRGELVRE